jgi:large subunit ribosomal protein L25
MKKHTLHASDRTVTGRHVRSIRKDGAIPATVYGKKLKSLTVSVEGDAFTKVYQETGETGLVELTVNNQMHPVLIHHVQYQPVTRDILHVEFFHVDLKEKVTANIPVEISGESQAVKDKAGALLQVLNTIEVEALPTDLPDKIAVDVTRLANVDDELKVGEIPVPDAVKILTDPEQLVVRVAPLVSKEAEAQAEEEAQQKADTDAENAGEGDTASQPTPTVEGKKEEPSK